jgi:enoyl-CoA hydratase
VGTETKCFELDRDGPVVIWKYHNPPKNLLSAKTWENLSELISEFSKDGDVRVAILTSALQDVFVQHYDVAELVQISELLRTSPDESVPQALTKRTQRPNLTKVPKPIICAINGWVAGGGCELSLDCDFRFMSKKATIGLPEVNSGILPPYGIQRLTRLLGVSKALELVMLGKIIDAEEAKRIGLVHRVCEPAELMPAAIGFAKELASRPPLAVTHIKRCIYEGTEMTIEEAWALSMQVVMQLARSDDAYRLMKEYTTGGQDRGLILELCGTPEAKRVYVD